MERALKPGGWSLRSKCLVGRSMVRSSRHHDTERNRTVVAKIREQLSFCSKKGWEDWFSFRGQEATRDQNRQRSGGGWARQQRGSFGFRLFGLELMSAAGQKCDPGHNSVGLRFHINQVVVPGRTGWKWNEVTHMKHCYSTCHRVITQ